LGEGNRVAEGKGERPYRVQQAFQGQAQLACTSMKLEDFRGGKGKGKN